MFTSDEMQIGTYSFNVSLNNNLSPFIPKKKQLLICFLPISKKNARVKYLFEVYAVGLQTCNWTRLRVLEIYTY